STPETGGQRRRLAVSGGGGSKLKLWLKLVN
ncbi:hypothetical protein MIMGU_mgv1a0084752mg, partial [Erythranthe guttata]